MAWLVRTIAAMGLVVGGAYALSSLGHQPEAIEETVARLRQAAQAEASLPVATSLRALTSKPAADPATGALDPATSPASDRQQVTRSISPPRPAPSPRTEALGAANRLTRAIQAELHRVGCYTGAIDGEWGPATRSAMAAFNDRIRARLPVEKPDYILLTLIQGHAARACGNACPLGQATDADGQCRARAEIAAATTPAEGHAGRSAPWARAIADAVRSAQSTTAGHADGTAEPPLPTRRAAFARPAEPAAGSIQEIETRRRAEAAAIAERASAQEKLREQEKARAEARARAEIESERRRIAAAEARRRELAAQLKARAEAERHARQVEAATRRRAEIAALAERRTAARTTETASITAASVTRAPVKPSSQPPAQVAAVMPLPQRPTPGSKPPAEVEAVAPTEKWIAEPKPTANRDDLRSAPRFVGRFIPPPTYRVGRLPPRPIVRRAAPARQRTVLRARVVQRPVRIRIAPSRVRTRAVFHQLVRNAP